MPSGGGGSVSAPPPSAAETALQQAQADNIQKQTDIVTQQYHDQQLIAPFLYQQAGLNPQYDAKGVLTGFTQDPTQVTLAKQQQDIQGKLNDNTLQALSGNAPVDPDLQHQLDTQKQTLQNQLAATLGPGYETSTPGQEALSNLNRTQASIVFGAKQGQLTLGEQLQLANQAGTAQTKANNIGLLTGINQGPLASASAFGQTVQGAGTAVQSLQNNRALTLQANMANAQIGQQNAAGMGQLFGSVVGAGGMLGAAAIM